MKTGVVLAAVMWMVPAVAPAQTVVRPSPEEQRRHDKISIMEGTLTSSVSVAARQVAKEVQLITPSAMLFTGEARAKGFTLEGYGVFFSVEIPTLDLSVMLTVETFERNARQREIQVGSSLRSDPQQSAMAPAASEALASVTAEGLKYRSAVKAALIDAMLDNSKTLELRPEEWLTVAARGSEAGLLPHEIYQLTTTVLRVKGSDLADFLAGRMTKDEARLRVEVRQF